MEMNKSLIDNNLNNNSINNSYGLLFGIGFFVCLTLSSVYILLNTVLKEVFVSAGFKPYLTHWISEVIITSLFILFVWLALKRVIERFKTKNLTRTLFFWGIGYLVVEAILFLHDLFATYILPNSYFDNADRFFNYERMEMVPLISSIVIKILMMMFILFMVIQRSKKL